jgi:hypothetical protein
MRTKNRLIKLVAALLAGVLISACSGALVQLGQHTDQKYDSTRWRRISAEACGFQLFLFIPIATNGRAERAYEALMKRAGDDYVADIQVQESWTYGVVGTAYCTTLEAKAYPRIKS